MTEAPTVTLRPATAHDSAELLAWRNDPLTRANSRNTGEISPEGHAAWLARTLRDPNRRLWIAMEGAVKAGTTSAVRDASGAVEISVTVAPAARGRGLGAAMVAAAVEGSRQVWPEAVIRAEIKPDNRASRAIFEACGFVAVREREGLLDYEIPA